MSTGYLRLDGGSVLIGLIGKCVRTSTFGESHIFRFHPHPCWMRLESEGLSHGLKTCHRHVFLTAFRVPSEHKKWADPKGSAHILVREMGLEPTRHNHTHLKRACLPFQHSRKRLIIITDQVNFVNTFFEKPLPSGLPFDKLYEKRRRKVKWHDFL